MYSCYCEHRDDWFHCGKCMEDATNDDPDYESSECPVCGKTTEIVVDEGLHESCSKIDSAGPYCLHTCDGRKEHTFGRSNSRGWFAGDDIPADLWTDCRACETVSNHRHRGNQNCDLDHIRCPNCNILAHEGVSFVQPFYFYLECNSCYIKKYEKDWPDEYYCDCCDGWDGISSWDEEAKDFYCGNCEKYHEDDETECDFFDEDDGYAHGRYDDDGDDTWDFSGQPRVAGYTESNQHCWINPSIVDSSKSIIGWDDKEIFFQFHCKRYVSPGRRRDDYDGCDESIFVAMRYDSRMHPREYFDYISDICFIGSMEKSQTPVYRRLGSMPNLKTEKTSESWNPTRREDFQKGDFQKGDFQKGDFQKGDFNISGLSVGEKYTTARLRRKGIFPHYDEYAKTKCRWKILEMETIVKKCLDGHSRKVINYVLEGKPKTKTGKTRQRPLKIKRVGAATDRSKM